MGYMTGYYWRDMVISGSKGYDKVLIDQGNYFSGLRRSDAFNFDALLPSNKPKLVCSIWLQFVTWLTYTQTKGIDLANGRVRLMLAWTIRKKQRMQWVRSAVLSA